MATGNWRHEARWATNAISAALHEECRFVYGARAGAGTHSLALSLGPGRGGEAAPTGD